MKLRPQPLLILGFKAAIWLYAMSNMALAQVGMQNFQVGSMPVTLVYPTQETVKPQSFGAFQISVAMNAKPSVGNQRLIVMSHGAGGGGGLTEHQLSSTLVKAGYIVAHLMHAGDNYKDTSKAGPESWKTRPLEVSQVIDALAKDAQWSRLFDTNKVGVYGMSAGGVTALVLAGGQWSLLTMLKHCDAQMDADLGFCFNGLTEDKAGQAKRKAQFQSAARAPEKYLPAELTTLQGTKDSRIKAISLAVPLVAPFTTSSLTNIITPIGVVSANNDEVLAPAFHSSYLLKLCKTCTPLIHLNPAGHFDVLAPWPTEVAKTVAAQQIRGGTPHPAFKPADRARAFDLITAFFNQHLITQSK